MSSVKIIEEISKMSVMELSELVKELEEKFGVSAAMPTAVAAAPAADQQAAQEEKTEFKVTLKDAGSEKIKAIKALRAVTSLSLIDAKKAVESAPYVVVESTTKEDAEKIKKALEEAGTKVELS
jgi:large subunit ribosomal protein L7/L12